jgi:hypothetical protein
MPSSAESLYLRRLIRLIEFSGEAALNADDSYFLRSSSDDRDREVIYVFDPTVFHFFLEPDDVKRAYSAYFHLRDWRNNYRSRVDEDYWILLNEMTACLTAEYMFSGQLKGQRGGKLYTSLWHFDQLLDTCSSFILNIYDTSASDSARAVHRRRLVLNHIRAALDNQPDHWVEQDDPLLAADERHFQEAVNRSNDAIGAQEAEALRLARRLARVVAQGREALVPDQLGLVTSLIDSQVVDSLEQRFNLSALDRDWVSRNARDWRSRLLKRDAARRGYVPQRREHGIEDDALSISLVQFIAREKIDHSRERIIFVTGDSLLKDTYADWYAEAYLRDPTESHVLRSIGYFSPILNMSDMRGLRDSSLDLFQLLQAALDIALMPFNLMSYKGVLAGSSLIKQRLANLSFLKTQLALKVDGKPTVLDDFLKDTAGSIDRGKDEYLEIIKKYQALERNSFRVGLELLQRRASRHVHNLSSLSDRDPSEAYFAEVIIKLVGSSAQLYAPLIERIILRGPSRLRPFARAGLALQIDGPGNQAKKLNIVSWVEQVLRRARVTRSVPQGHQRQARGRGIARPSLGQVRWSESYLVLVVGAIVALRRGLWHRAGHFAEGAKVAFRHMGDDPSVAPNAATHAELRYLAGFTARYIIGSMQPTEGGGGEDVWLKYLSKATFDLDICVEYYRRAQVPLLELRSIAERASCNLFYASWSLADQEPIPGGYSDQQALDCLAIAVRELALSFDMLMELPSQNLCDELIMKYVRRQIFGSIASAYLVGEFLPTARRRHRFGSSFMRDIKQPFDDWRRQANPAELPEVVKIECRHFGRRLGLPDIWDNMIGAKKPTVRLALDELLIAKFGGTDTGQAKA